MNVSFFIAQRLRYQKDSETFSATVIRIATTSVALGMAIMLVAFAVLEGFRHNITAKVFSLGAHINVASFGTNGFSEEKPISLLQPEIQNLRKINGVTHCQSYIYKPGLLKTDEAVQGVLLKGLDMNFNAKALSDNLIQGRLPDLRDTTKLTEVLVSQKIAKLLRLKVADEVLMYFVQQPSRIRKLQVVGIYETGMEEFDDNMIIGNATMIRQLNNWPSHLVSGVELFLSDIQTLDATYENVIDVLPYDLSAMKVTEQHLQIFEWLEMIGRNVEVLLVLITLVACFSMVSSLLIMILERTRMIGTLKAMGASDGQIRNIFLWSGLRLTLRGMLWGNAIGLGFCALQYQFHFIPLDPENYYMYYVPIAWNYWAFIWLNVLTLLLTAIVLLLPTRIIAGIKPIKAIKFD